MKAITIYTDGACEGNPGPGGYGVVVLDSGQTREYAGGFRLTTNNRMELMAAIIGVESIKMPAEITLITDSKYLSDAINKGWAARWQANRWKKADKGKVENIDLWKRFLTAIERHQFKVKWVKGHSGNRYNEICDKLAVAASKQSDLPADKKYEKTGDQRQTKFNLFG